MATMCIDDAIFGDLPDPKMEGHARVVQIIAKSSIGFDQDVLNNIADVDATLDFPIEPHLHDMPERVAMAFEQFIDGVGLSVANAIEEGLGLIAIGPNGIRHGLLAVVRKVDSFLVYTFVH